MASSSDAMKKLLAKYGKMKTPTSREKKTKVNKLPRKPVAPEPKKNLSSLPPPSAEPQASDYGSPGRGFLPIKAPLGLAWDTFKGVKVLVSEIQNFVAERSPNGTYTVVRLKPYSVVGRRLQLKDVLPTMQKYNNQDVEFAVREAERQRETAQQAQNRIDAFENNPGFYIVPGETVGPDDEIHNATGPYYRFESIGRNFEDLPEGEFETDDDVEEEAIIQMRRGDGERVKIIEARNAREAAAGRGYVWWDQGNLRGPPVDSRQKGFGW